MNGYSQVTLTFCTQPAVKFRLRIPMTESKMEQGLIGLPRLRSGEGMLFLSDRYPRPEKITLHLAPYPLDMIWLGLEGNIVSIERDVQEHEVKGHVGIGAIEVLAGTARALGLRVGTSYVF